MAGRQAGTVGFTVTAGIQQAGSYRTKVVVYRRRPNQAGQA